MLQFRCTPTAVINKARMSNIQAQIAELTRGTDEVLPENYRTRMMEFGFHPGETVACLLSVAFGAPKVYRVSNTIFSLDEEVADHIQVRVLGPDG